MLKPPPPPPPKTIRKIASTRAGECVSPGNFGLKSTGRIHISVRRTLSIKRALKRQVRGQGQIWIRCAAEQALSQPVHDGQILFELQGVRTGIARKALRSVLARLPMDTQLTS